MRSVGIVTLVVLASALAACNRDLDEAHCPCLPGWTCCPESDRCVREGSNCVASPKNSSAVSCESAASAVDPQLLIDDMEGEGATASPVTANPIAFWWKTDDMTGGTSWPAEPVPDILSEPRCGSHQARRFAGQGYRDWGAIMGLSFLPARDARAYTGVTFWAAVGRAPTKGVDLSLNANAADPSLDCPLKDHQDGQPCVLPFNTRLAGLSSAWQRFELPFATFAPQYLGTHFDPGALEGLMFHCEAPEFEFWVDELAFY